jgi:hypothetical protein
MKIKAYKVILIGLSVVFILFLSFSAWFIYSFRKYGDIASDQVEMLGNSHGYYLVQRIQGWQDKSITFEIYKNNPSFDAKGKTTSELIARCDYDPKEGFIKKMTVKKDVLEIDYTQNEGESIEPSADKLGFE